jgi:hypothetical protein
MNREHFRVRITVWFSSGMEANVASIGEWAVLLPSLPKENCPAIRYIPLLQFRSPIRMLFENQWWKWMMQQRYSIWILFKLLRKWLLQRKCFKSIILYSAHLKSHNESIISYLTLYIKKHIMSNKPRIKLELKIAQIGQINVSVTWSRFFLYPSCLFI